MPIPILFMGIGAGLTAVGAGKTVKAGLDQKEAGKINNKAKRITDRAMKATNSSRKRSGNAVLNLGNRKIEILEDSIKPFIASFEKLHNVTLQESIGMNELNKFKLDKQSFEQLKEIETVASSLAVGVGSGAAIGAITAFGAYNGVMALGVASTGTAIASLSGVAATNATLAFLGGGSLAAGGLGMAGGTMVLGGLVAGPALAVMGFIVGAKANANKNEAYANLAKAKEFAEESLTIQSLCRGIRMRAALYDRMLIKLNAVLTPMVYQLQKTIEEKGTDYSEYTEDEKKNVAMAMSVAGAVKAILDTSLLTEEGMLTQESEEMADKMQGVMAAL